MFIHALLTTAAIVMAPPASRTTAAPDRPVIDDCDIASVRDLNMPASDAGMIITLHVEPGARVEKGMKLATIDDREAQAVYQVRKYEYEIAKLAADSELDVLHTQKAADVARQVYEKYKYIYDKDRAAVNVIEYLRTKFEWEKALLSVDKSKETVASNRITADSKKAEMETALVAVQRRTLYAPFNGVVAMVKVQEGEWVQPGDPIVELVRIDRLRIYGDVEASKWTRSDLEDRKVTIEVALPRGQETIDGKITFVSPIVGVGSKLAVQAEIETPMQNGQPLVYAGMKARMVIHTDQPPVADTQPAANPSATRPTAKR